MGPQGSSHPGQRRDRHRRRTRFLKRIDRACAAAVIAATLFEIDPRYPVMDDAARAELGKAKAELEAEAPPGALADPAAAGSAAKMEG